MWETWRDSWRESWGTYISFVLVGAIFILCQALSGGTTGHQPEDATADPGDRTYREALRDETSGLGGPTLRSANRPLAAPARFPGSGESRQTD